MKFISRYRFEIIAGVIIIIFYFLFRLPNLTLQPIFADEAIYIRWAQVMRAEPTLRFLPLSDGKTPLFMWSMIPLFKVFDDPLYAGRFLSSLSGLGTLFGVFLLSLRIFNLKVAFWAALLYTVVPYTVFFDRMALVDSMFSAFTVWSIYLAVWLVQSPRLDLAMILGYFLGGSILVKTPGMINLLVLPVSILGFDFKNRQRYSLVKLFLLWLVAIFIALTAYNILKLGPGFNMLSSRNADYIFSPIDLLGRPLDPFLPHFNDIKDWFPTLLTWPILLLALWGVVLVLWQRHRLGLVILLWLMVPLLLQMAFLKTFTARYLLFSIPPLLIICGYGVEQLVRRFGQRSLIVTIFLILLILPQPLFFDYKLLTDLEKAPLPKAERRGYLEDWTAGYGFPEIAEFLKNKRKENKVVVGTEGYFGTLPDGLQIYLNGIDIQVIGSSSTISAQLKDSAKKNQTFFVGNKNRLPNQLEGAKFIKEYPKIKPLDGNPPDAIVLYQVIDEEL